MTVKEMHIDVGQSTQKIGANANRKLRPDEIDWLLNKTMERFIRSKIKPRPDGSGAFEIDQIDVDAVRTLLRSAVLTPEYSKYAGETVYTAHLPGDYSYLISDDSAVTDLCGDTYTRSTGSLPVTILPFPTSTLGASPYYAAVTATITAGGSIVSSIATINTERGGTYTGQLSKQDRFMVIRPLLEDMRTKGLNVYWESYAGLYKPYSFIIPGATASSIDVDGTVTAGTQLVRTYSYYNYPAEKWVTNRLTASNRVSALNGAAYYRTNKLSPVSELTEGSLKVYGDDASFIVTKVRAQYIKKPRRISLTLCSDCELPEDFHNTICDLSSEYFKKMIQDPNWEVKMQDNIQRDNV